MTAKWISDSRQRASKRYKAIHEMLKQELERDKQPLTDKSSRKRERSRVFHQTGNE